MSASTETGTPFGSLYLHKVQKFKSVKYALPRKWQKQTNKNIETDR